MTAAEAVSPFAEAAPDLIALGFGVIPIIPPGAPHKSAGKSPGRWVSGGWQGLSAWAKFKDCAPSSFEMGMWMRAPGAGVGLLCGTPAGKLPDGTQLVVVGIDCDVDSEDLDTILRVLPGPVRMAKAGNLGQTVFVRAPAHMVSKSYDRAATAETKATRLVDWLAAGRQTVVPGSVHVSTGKPYVWIAGPCSPEELPVFTEDHLTELEETLETLGWVPATASARASVDHVPVHREPGNYADDFARANGEGLARLHEWFADLGLPGTAQTRSGVWSAVPVWRESNTGRPLSLRKSNLSASSGQGGVPAGIKDWGASGPDATMTAIDLVMKALSLEAVEAMHWLTAKLNLDEDDGSVTIDLAAFLASRETPPPAPDADSSGRGASSLVAARAGDNMPGPLVRETHGARDIPAHLIRECPGLLGGLAQYINDTARKSQPTLALAAALTVIGTAAGRRYAGPTMSGTHLYAVMIGGSGAGKEHPLDMVARILEAAGMGQHVGPGEFMSFQAAYRAIGRQPLLLCAMDELGSWLNRLSRKGASGNEGPISAVLRSAWGKSFGKLPVPSWAGFDAPDIYVPAVSILGASTPDEFFKSLESGAIDNGFLNRWLCFPTYTRPKQRRPIADKFTVPEQISEGLSAIYNVGGSMVNATMHNGRADKPFVQAVWEGGDEGPLAAEFMEWAGVLDEQSDTETLYARCAEQTVRIATIRAIGTDAHNPVVDRACFTWARELVEWCTEAMISQAADFMAENQTQADRARVLRAIKAAGVISHRDLTRKLTSFKARELEDIVKTLTGAEQVQATNVVNETNGKTTKFYTYTGGE